MKDNFKKQLWFSFGIIFGAILIAGIAVYYISNDITAQGEKIVIDKTTTNSQTGALATLAELEMDAPTAATYTSAMEALLPTEDQLFNFSEWIETFGKTYNINAQASFNGSPTVAVGTTPGTAGFSLEAEGAPSDLVTFLTALETSSTQFLVQLNSFNLLNENPSYKIVAQGNVFFR